MKINKKRIQYALVALPLAIHLFNCNSQLMMINDAGKSSPAMIYFGAIAFSVMSAYCISEIKNLKIILAFAILDSCGVWIEKEGVYGLIPTYLALYTGILTIFAWLVFSHDNNTKQETEQSQEQEEPVKQDFTKSDLTKEESEILKSLTYKLNASGKDHRISIIKGLDNPRIQQICAIQYKIDFKDLNNDTRTRN